RVEECLQGVAVDGHSGNALAGGDLAVYAEIIADVTDPLIPVSHHHLVPAVTAVDQSVEQRRACPRNAPGQLVRILRVIVVKHTLDCLKRGPTDIGRVLVRDADFPLLDRPPPPRLPLPPDGTAHRPHA